MKLEETFSGKELPFEGDHTIRLQGIPKGAHITEARAKVAVAGSEVEIVPNDDDRSWGATKKTDTVETGEGTSAYVMVDFHTQRTATRLRGITFAPATVKGPTLQIDLGGVWASVKADGTLVAPGESAPYFPDGRIPTLTVQRFQLSTIAIARSGEQITLDGTRLTVIGRAPLSYQWLQTGGTTVELSGTTAVQPTFVAPGVASEGETLVFELTVTDSQGTATSGSFVVDVIPSHTVISLDVTSVVCTSFPSNVTLGLAGEDPFWVHPGELSNSVQVPDFCEFLNAYLEQAEATGGYLVLPLTIHSDTIAFLEVTFEIAYHLDRQLAEQALIFSPVNLRDPANALELQFPPGATIVPGQAGLTLTGGFEADRIVPGAVEEGAERVALEVTPGRTFAQALRLEVHHDVIAIDLHLAKPRTQAEIHVSLQTNAAGKPSGQVLATAEIQPEKLSAEGAQWTTVELSDTVKLSRQTTYWLVLSAL